MSTIHVQTIRGMQQEATSMSCIETRARLPMLFEVIFKSLRYAAAVVGHPACFEIPLPAIFPELLVYLFYTRNLYTVRTEYIIYSMNFKICCKQKNIHGYLCYLKFRIKKIVPPVH